jgi:acyl carrier protein
VTTNEEARERVEQWLTQWFVAQGKVAGKKKDSPEPSRDIDYFEAGWLTSMEVVEFVTRIEERFNMQFSDRDLQDSRFPTISGLAGIIVESSTDLGGK